MLTSISSDVLISLTHDILASSIMAGSTVPITCARAASTKLLHICGTTSLTKGLRDSSGQFQLTHTPQDLLTRAGDCQM